MSVVTDVVLLTVGYDGCTCDITNPHPNIDEVNKYLDRYEHSAQLHKVDDYGANRKRMQCDVFIGAFNYLNIENFVQAVKAVQWENRECVQLLIKDEEEDVFKMIEI